MKLNDLALDRIAANCRDALLLEWLRRQIALMRKFVHLCRDRLRMARVDEDSSQAMPDLSLMPGVPTERVRATRPAALLPNGEHLDLHVGRWTSGTSGRPTVNFWTQTDWEGLVASTARMLARQAPMQAPIVFNGYSQGPLTGPLYH